MQYKIVIYNHQQPFYNDQIVLDPVISGTMCSGGVSGGGCSTKTFEFSLWAPEWIDMSDHLGYAVQLYADVDVFPEQCYGDWYITEYTKMENGRHKFKCCDAIGYYGEDYATDYAELDGDGTVTATDAAALCLAHLGLTSDSDFTTWVEGSAEIPKKDLRGKKYRDILAYLAARSCVNVYEHHGKLSVWAPWISKSTVYSSIYAPIKNTCSTSFTKTSVAGDKTYVSGTGAPEKTFYHKYKCANQDSADSLLTNLSGYTYKAFKCDKCIVSSNVIDNGIRQWADVGDTFSPASAQIMSFKLILNPRGVYGTFGADILKKNIDKPVDETEGSSGTSLLNLQNFAGGISGTTGQVTLTWTLPSTPIDTAIIKRKRSTAFSSIFDGDVIEVGNGTALEYHDTPPDLYHSWHYRTLTRKGDLYNGSDNGICVAALQRGKYLYNAGDQCTAVTGGWTSGAASLPRNTSKANAYWRSDHVYTDTADEADTDMGFWVCGCKTSNKVNFTGFTKICAEVEFTAIKKYFPLEDEGLQAALSRPMPVYSHADVGVTAEEYPYVFATYRNTANTGRYGYLVFFSKMPFTYVHADGIARLKFGAGTIFGRYYGDGSGIHSYDSMSTYISLLPPTDTPDTTTYGDYMGGAYHATNNRVYAIASSDAIKYPTDVRFWMSTKQLNNYDWTEKVSYATIKQNAAIVGSSMVVEMSLGSGNLNTEVVPNTFGNYVTFGAFEADTKVHAIWLQE